MRRISTEEADFPACLEALRERGAIDLAGVEAAVAEIIGQVRTGGDAALVELARRFDGAELGDCGLRVEAGEILDARKEAAPETLRLLERAAGRIRAFHQEQARRSWFVSDAQGNLMGQRVSPVASAGLYVPGGKAAYPSTVLMNAIPAQVAGVERVVVCTPAANGRVHPLVLVAADLLGIREIYRVGGAQAVAAMAYGTETVPRVEKIVGPGNIYVATAKKSVYGRVSIDMVAGPSEVFVVADADADPVHVAADLLSQAEHDEMATCVLLTDSPELAGAVSGEVNRQLAGLPRAGIARASLAARGWIILTRDIREAVDLANELGPEHLEVQVRDPLAWLPAVRYAGSVFFGPRTPEAMGDYMAGPNHVLPTGGAARHSSTLGVDDFLVRSNVLFLTSEGFGSLAEDVVSFAELEGLGAHAESVRKRLPA